MSGRSTPVDIARGPRELGASEREARYGSPHSTVSVASDARRGEDISHRAIDEGMNRGVEVGIYLRPGLANDNYIAEALGNLAAFRLAKARGERLEWQVLRVNGSSQHHYRIVLRHPDRWLDVGFRSELERILESLSDETVEELRRRVETAQADGLRLIPLRAIQEEVDFWQDDFWSAIGGPSGIAGPGSFP